MGRALFPGDEAICEGWIETWSHRLKHEGGETVLKELRSLSLDGREAVRKAHGEVLGYFENHVHIEWTIRRTGQGMGERLGADRIGVLDSDRQADEERGDALGRE